MGNPLDGNGDWVGGDAWQQDFLVALPGDATFNGMVDAADFDQWYRHRFSPGDWRAGDFSHDGFVDETDLALWETNKYTNLNPMGNDGGVPRTPRAPLEVLPTGVFPVDINPLPFVLEHDEEEDRDVAGSGASIASNAPFEIAATWPGRAEESPSRSNPMTTVRVGRAPQSAAGDQLHEGELRDVLVDLAFAPTMVAADIDVTVRAVQDGEILVGTFIWFVSRRLSDSK